MVTGTPEYRESSDATIHEVKVVRALIIVFSYHHHNTETIARAIAGVLGAEVKTPGEILPEKLRDYDLIGFGSGVCHASFGQPMLTLADRLSFAHGKKAFLFSTYGAPAVAVTRVLWQTTTPRCGRSCS